MPKSLPQIVTITAFTIATLLLASNADAQILKVKVTGGEVEGKLNGKDGKSGTTFKGIPFAAPPVGPLRWKPPQPVVPWEGVKKADKFGPSPMQDGMIPMLAGVPPQRSEDCLYLNVWTPAKKADEKLPVMVWIYGGAYIMGSASQAMFDGSRWAEKGVVYVNFNYRVGAFGFLATPELTKEGNGVSGNYGILDQIAALKWVQENIAQFGGDPNCVTIFGVSAGGESVNILASTPKAKGLFHRAISHSGPGFLPPKVQNDQFSQASWPTLAYYEKSGDAFLASIKAKDIAAAREVKAADISKANFVATVNFDGDVLPKDQCDLFKEGKFNDVPMMAGSNSDDGGALVLIPIGPITLDSNFKLMFSDQADKFLALYPHENNAEATRSMKDLITDIGFRYPAWKWAKLQTEKGKNKAYVYYFDHPAGKASHGAEHAFVFHMPPGNGMFDKTVSPENQKLSDVMNSYWVNFAKTGNPNGPDLPEWSAFDAKVGKVMTFEGSASFKDMPHPERMEAIDAFFHGNRSPATQPMK